MTKRSDKIVEIFEFLKRNHHFNQKIQRGYIQQTLASCRLVEDKARLLLFKTYNTRSQPNLDNMAVFFKNLESSKESLSSFKNFKRFVKVLPDSED